jgi:thiol-disulfide isomerase/thioredoxin
MPPRMNFDRMLTIALVVALVLGGAIMARRTFSPAAPAPAAAGAALPDVTLTDGAGQPLRLSEFRGKIVLVNLWASWCAPCVSELPALNALQAKLGPKGLKVVAVSVDTEPAEKITAFLAARDVPLLPLYRDAAREIQMKWRYGGIPASFLLDAEGRVLKAYEGPREWDKGAPLAEIEAALK